MVMVTLRRSSVCDPELELFDEFAKGHVDRDPDSIRIEWTQLADLWLRIAYPHVAAWLCDKGLVPRAADFRGVDLRGVDLRDAYLRDADLRDADLCDADLRNANLRGADLRDADMSNADLLNADLTGADLRDADLDGTDPTLVGSVWTSHETGGPW
jgi:uncharacterized protein YjbI with pentapeptide repeats